MAVTTAATVVVTMPAMGTAVPPRLDMGTATATATATVSGADLSPLTALLFLVGAAECLTYCLSCTTGHDHGGRHGGHDDDGDDDDDSPPLLPVANSMTKNCSSGEGC